MAERKEDNRQINAADLMEKILEQNLEGLKIGELYDHLQKLGYDLSFCRSTFLLRLAHKIDLTGERRIKLLPEIK